MQQNSLGSVGSPRGMSPAHREKVRQPPGPPAATQPLTHQPSYAHTQPHTQPTTNPRTHAPPPTHTRAHTHHHHRHPCPDPQVRFIFDCFDGDRDGRLSVEELRQLLLAINKKLQTSTYLQVEQATERVFEVGGRGGALAGWRRSLQGCGGWREAGVQQAAGCRLQAAQAPGGGPLARPPQVYSRYTDGRGLRLEGLQKAYEEGAGGWARAAALAPCPLPRRCQPGPPRFGTVAASRTHSKSPPRARTTTTTTTTTTAAAAPAGDLDRDYSIVAAWEKEGGRALPPIRASSYLGPSGGHSPRAPQSPRLTGSGVGFTREEKIAIMFKCFDRDGDGRWAGGCRLAAAGAGEQLGAAPGASLPEGLLLAWRAGASLGRCPGPPPAAPGAHRPLHPALCTPPPQAGQVRAARRADKHQPGGRPPVQQREPGG